MQKTSPQTKSFIVLLGLAAIGTFLCLYLWGDLLASPAPVQTINNQNGYQTITYSQKAAAAPEVAGLLSPVPPVDTSTWKTYTNTQYGFSFKYAPAWAVKAAAQSNGFDVIQIDPGKKVYNIKIYISPTQFYAMDGLPTKTETIGGLDALNVNNALYGIKTSNYYFTFDVGESMSLVPEFNALVHSVQFEN